MRTLVAVLLLALASVAAAALGGAFSRRQLECLASRKVLHQGGCYALLEQGPCGDGNRLTLDEAALPQVSVACTPCRCCDLPRAVWWSADRACHRARDEDELCGGESTGTYLGEDLFGDGACLCRPGHARPAGEHSGPCHALYQRGPCPQGQVFIAVRAEDDGNPRCADDPCAYENSGHRNVTFARADDGRCYPLGSRGHCPDDSSFNVHPETLRPQCIDRTNNIVKLPCLEEAADVNGSCKESVQPEDDASFGITLIRSAKNKRSAKSRNRT